MSGLLTLGLSSLVALGITAAVLTIADGQSPTARLFARYRSWWEEMVNLSRAEHWLKSIPIWQTGIASALIAIAVGLRRPLIAVGIPVIMVLPAWLLVRYRERRIQTLENGLAEFLVALADSLTTIPNLTEALQTLVEHIEPPIKEEVVAVLAEVRLGRSFDDALRNMASRVRLPGLDAAVGAALLGKRTGGDLSGILRRIAETLREMARLEGVIRTKTAEGRSQAWVMGSVPPGLMLMLEKIDPDWLAPLWNDPIGWLMLGGVAVLEVSAIALIRKIMAVDI
ncbi:MAG: hypothetical protein GY854_29095 [Deltaproteobacteria bacterium]|nr:hypothetical protein [Deltaproteobacteria bacterium]